MTVPQINFDTKVSPASEPVQLTDEEVVHYNKTGEVPKSALDRAGSRFYVNLDPNVKQDFKMTFEGL